MYLRAVIIWIVSLGSLLFMAQASHAFVIAPSSIELEANRGEVVSGAVTIMNTSDVRQTYYLGTLKFEPRDEGGSPMFITYEEDHTGLPEWIAFSEESVSLLPDEFREVSFQVAVPADIASGTHYAAVTVSRAPADIIPGGATVEAKSAALLFVDVLGETTEEVTLLDFGLTDSSWVSRLPISFTYRLQNQGNIAVVPDGWVELRYFAGESFMQRGANQEKGKLLPGATRSYKVVYEPADHLQGIDRFVKEHFRLWAPGPYIASLSLEYGEKGSINSESIIWVIPWQTVTILAILFLVILFLTKKKQRKK